MNPITIARGNVPMEETLSMHPASETSLGGRRRGLMVGLAALLVVMMGCCLWTAGADAAPKLTFSSFSAGAYNADSTPATQAGAHPYELRSGFEFGTSFSTEQGLELPNANVKDTVFDIPAGVVGDPRAVPQCRQQDMNVPGSACPTATQIGYADVDLKFLDRETRQYPIYNMEPPAGQPAQFAFLVIASVVHIDLKVRSNGDYGVTATVRNANATSPLYGVTVHLWGVPADPSHDALRFRPFVGVPGDAYGAPLSSPLSRTPLLRNPTSCTGPVTTTLTATSWQEPNQPVVAQAAAPAVTGCGRVPFNPTVSFAPDSRQAGSGSGVAVDVDVPQNKNPDGLASADVKRVVMKLPNGVTINPSAADGLAGCTDTDFAIKSEVVDSCPRGSKIGSATVTSPLLENPLEGSLFLASPLEQGPLAAASGRMFRLFLTAEGSGVRVKLAGSVVPDPVTGQLTATFDNNPQLPFSNLHLQLVGGSRAPLATPKACGTYTTTAELTPWTAPDAPTVTATNSFTIDQNCANAARFEPVLNAGLVNPVAGGSSPFTMTLSRPDGQVDISGVDLTLPAGLLGKVGSVPQCIEAAAAAGSCSAASQVGSVVVASGAGSSPLQVPQPGKAPTAVYLAGPYKGAPFSLSIVVPAQAGPFDLGTVVVRAALFVDPRDGHVTVKSDPLPTILDGVPLNVQKINVTVDRPGFIVAPTNCDPMAVAGDVRSVTGAVAHVTNRFQVGECARLGLKPKLGLAFSGKGQTTDGKHPAVTATLTQTPGQANLKKVRVALPLSVALDPDNAQALCDFTQGSKVEPNCPAGSIVGTATATTPVLDGPVSGPVYFVKNERKDPKSGRSIKTLPKLVIPLVGQNGVKLVLTGTSDVVDNQLVTTFATIPDAPVSSFKLDIVGGKGGILVVSGADICKSTQVADQQINGQNGKTANTDITIQTPSCPLKVISKKTGKTSVAVKVGGLGAGKVTVTGKGIKKTTKTITSATVATITAHRTNGTPGKVTVTFDPAGPAKAHKTTK
jgi:hypothetical protein